MANLLINSLILLVEKRNQFSALGRNDVTKTH